MKRFLLSLIVALLVLPVQARDVPFLSGRVNDTAGMLSGSALQELEAMLKVHEDSTSNQVAVLTVASLEGEVLEEYSFRVAETWALGQAEKDNGVLILVARDDRKVRIEVGSGLEGDLTDALSGRIIRNEIVPRFRDGDFDAGLVQGTRAVLAAIEGSYEADESDWDEWEGEELMVRLVAGLIFTIVIGIFTSMAVVSSGFVSWFLFVFLIPFWISFPAWILGPTIGWIPFVLYFVGFILIKIWLAKTGRGKKIAKKWTTMSASGGGWSSS
ncbi:MAG: TPM domain-containing protein, partial [Ignavibacteria bacterium]|nr:TPM domain-containing protein [Ignavibacteria bacterium]